MIEIVTQVQKDQITLGQVIATVLIFGGLAVALLGWSAWKNRKR